jgi:hypothetical protein
MKMNTQTATQIRKPRFKRVPVENIQLTDRDLAILRHVHKHRFLRSSHIVQLVGGSQQAVVRRLQLLYHHDYLDRPREQIPFYTCPGSKPMVYGLGNAGADILAQHLDVPRGKVNWTAKNKAVGPIFLEHTLLAADFMVALEAACRKSGRVRLIEAGEILEQAPEAARRRRNPFAWNVAFRHQDQMLTLGVIPDRMFGLHYLDKPEGKNKAYFFLEADRATMPVMRSNLRQTSLYRKILAYHETWKQGLPTRQYGFNNFRVLTVTSSAERVRNCIEATKQALAGEGSRLFLFTDKAALEGGDSVLHLPWRNGKDGQPVTPFLL